MKLRAIFVSVITVLVAFAGLVIASPQANAVVIRKPSTISRSAKVTKGKAPSMRNPKLSPRSCPSMGNTRLWTDLFASTSDLEKKGDGKGQMVVVQKNVKNPKILRVVMDVPERQDLNGSWLAGWYNSRNTVFELYTSGGDLIKSFTMWHKDGPACHVYPIPGVSLRTYGSFIVHSRTQWVHYWAFTQFPFTIDTTTTYAKWNAVLLR